MRVRIAKWLAIASALCIGQFAAVVAFSLIMAHGQTTEDGRQSTTLAAATTMLTTTYVLFVGFGLAGLAGFLYWMCRPVQKRQDTESDEDKAEPAATAV